MPEPRKLNVFLCHSSGDKPKVREIYRRLCAEPWISPWLDEEMLIPGMDWNFEIEKALRAADVILFCLSAQSVSKEGYVQKEIKRALDIADEKPDGTIYDIPLLLETCEIPTRLSKKQWLDYFADGAHEKLLKSLKIRAEGLQISTGAKISDAKPTPATSSTPSEPLPVSTSDLDLYTFIKINVLGQKPFWIGKYPVTNAQYARFLQSDDFANPQYWIGFPKFDENCKPIGNWGEEGLNWLREKLKDYEFFPPEIWKVEPYFWRDDELGLSHLDNPVVGVTWYEANAYCKWLAMHWDDLLGSPANQLSSPRQVRLPLETEWIAAAGGDRPEGRYPWDLPSRITTNVNEIVERANIKESQIGKITPVKRYPEGKSPHGVMDMAGNIWEWQANCRDTKKGSLAWRGGSWYYNQNLARVSHCFNDEFPQGGNDQVGFRVVTIPGT
jgi:formylglycine-generating enzyme required for sulfatase activity